MSTRQYITFRLGTHRLGLPVETVREVNRLLTVTPVQHVPDYVRGLMNLRGQIVTVFDLGVRLRVPDADTTGRTHNIIMKDDDVGLLVDAIGDVVEVDADSIRPVPANIKGLAPEFLDGVYELPNALLALLSAERLLTPADEAQETAASAL